MTDGRASDINPFEPHRTYFARCAASNKSLANRAASQGDFAR
jgi:hypothetical protein